MGGEEEGPSRLASVCPLSPPGPLPSASPVSPEPSPLSWGRCEEQMWTRPEPRPLLHPAPPSATPHLGSGHSLRSLSLQGKCRVLPLLCISSRGQPAPPLGARLAGARLGGAVSQALPTRLRFPPWGQTPRPCWTPGGGSDHWPKQGVCKWSVCGSQRPGLWSPNRIIQDEKMPTPLKSGGAAGTGLTAPHPPLVTTPSGHGHK